MTRFGDPRLRYLLVGGLCAATHNAIVIGAAFAGVHYLASIGVSYVVVVVLGYGLHARFTFGEPSSIASFAKYAVAMLGNYPLTAALMFLACSVFRAPVAIASPAATLVLVAWNYFASRWAIGRRPWIQASGLTP